ncbi:hypothetical protein Sjap_010943 [Stephania japonica]|uniref:Uncharacterized protein n=1 Tax=Stephania japonica TaxID=461633 RepID=A0AAP0JCF0_9MAGN
MSRSSSQPSIKHTLTQISNYFEKIPTIVNKMYPSKVCSKTEGPGSIPAQAKKTKRAVDLQKMKSIGKGNINCLLISFETKHRGSTALTKPLQTSLSLKKYRRLSVFFGTLAHQRVSYNVSRNTYIRA